MSIWERPPPGGTHDDRREWWAGLALGDLSARVADGDYGELCDQSEFLWEIANEIEAERDDSDDEPDELVGAIRAYCTVISDAAVNQAGTRVLKRGVRRVEVARARLAGALESA